MITKRKRGRPRKEQPIIVPILENVNERGKETAIPVIPVFSENIEMMKKQKNINKEGINNFFEEFKQGVTNYICEMEKKFNEKIIEDSSSKENEENSKEEIDDNEQRINKSKKSVKKPTTVRHNDSIGNNSNRSIINNSEEEIDVCSISDIEEEIVDEGYDLDAFEDYDKPRSKISSRSSIIPFTIAEPEPQIAKTNDPIIEELQNEVESLKNRVKALSTQNKVLLKESTIAKGQIFDEFHGLQSNENYEVLDTTTSNEPINTQLKKNRPRRTTRQRVINDGDTFDVEFYNERTMQARNKEVSNLYYPV